MGDRRVGDTEGAGKGARREAGRAGCTAGEVVAGGDGAAASAAWAEVFRSQDVGGGEGSDRLEKTAQRTATASSTTRLTYDILGRLVRTEDPQGRLTRLGYDELGNRTLSISAAGDRIRYATDPRGLLIHRTSEAPSPATIDDTYAYDGFGRRVVEQNGDSTREYTYDDLDRIVAVYDPDFGTIRRVFDADGRMTRPGSRSAGPRRRSGTAASRRRAGAACGCRPGRTRSARSRCRRG